MALFIPSAGECLAVAGPVAAVCGIAWFASQGDQLIARLFPHWEWERTFGWLNLRANRRAEFILRGVRHVMHACLLAALAGVLTLSWMAGQPQDMDSKVGVFTFALELIYIGICLGPWIYYFKFVLGPRVRAEYEEEELRRYRLEHPEENDDQPKEAPAPRITVWGATRSFRRM